LAAAARVQQLIIQTALKALIRFSAQFRLQAAALARVLRAALAARAGLAAAAVRFLGQAAPATKAGIRQLKVMRAQRRPLILTQATAAAAQALLVRPHRHQIPQVTAAPAQPRLYLAHL
jgi:hypothetical protein